MSWSPVPSGKAARVALNYLKTNLPPSLGIQMRLIKQSSGSRSRLIKGCGGNSFRRVECCEEPSGRTLQILRSEERSCSRILPYSFNCSRAEIRPAVAVIGGKPTCPGDDFGLDDRSSWDGGPLTQANRPRQHRGAGRPHSPSREEH